MILTTKDIADLDRIESEIEQDQTSFLRLADNLMIIRDRKLYLREYKSFEAYCQNRWGWGRDYVNKQIRSAKVIRGLPEKTVDTIVSRSVRGLTEGTAREIAGLAPESRMEVLEHVVAKDEPITSKSITESAKVIAKRPDLNGESSQRRDATGWIIPKERLLLFERSPRVEAILDKLADVRGFVRRMQEAAADPMYREVSANDILMQLDGLYADLKRAIPYAVCPYCQGIKADTCMSCRQRGVMSKHLWDTAVPIELKEIRKRTLEDK